MGTGIALTLLQAFSEFFKALARSRGLIIEENIPERLIVEGNLEELQGTTEKQQQSAQDKP